LLRGQGGTESAMRIPIAAGARVVILDDALKPLGLSQSEYALPFNYLYGPQGKRFPIRRTRACLCNLSAWACGHCRRCS
jgi:hypothetical protein